MALRIVNRSNTWLDRDNRRSAHPSSGYEKAPKTGLEALSHTRGARIKIPGSPTGIMLEQHKLASEAKGIEARIASEISKEK